MRSSKVVLYGEPLYGTYYDTLLPMISSLRSLTLGHSKVPKLSTKGRYDRRVGPRQCMWLAARADRGKRRTIRASDLIPVRLTLITEEEIARATHHSQVAVDRYLSAYQRIWLLTQRIAKDQLPVLSGAAPSVVALIPGTDPGVRTAS